MEIVKEAVLDILDQQGPALSSTNDVPVIETKPDAVAAPAEQPKAKEPATPEPETTAEQPGESATPATEEDSGQPAGDEPRGVGKALAKLRQEKREAEERERLLAERLGQATEALERFNKAQEPKPAEVDPEPVKPTRTEFPDQVAYDMAMDVYIDQKASWVARKEVQAVTEKTRQEVETKLIEEQQRVAREAYASRVEKVRERHADYEEFAHAPDVQVSMHMAHAIIQSENGPELQYYLGKNPAEAQRIMALPADRQLMEMGRIEARLSEPQAAPVAAAPKPAVSAAPKPIKPVSAGREPPPFDPETVSMDEYAANWRAREKASRARH
jgi:hypothetical protein